MVFNLLFVNLYNHLYLSFFLLVDFLLLIWKTAPLVAIRSVIFVFALFAKLWIVSVEILIQMSHDASMKCNNLDYVQEKIRNRTLNSKFVFGRKYEDML